MIDPVVFDTLRRFWAGVYDRFGARHDALFELLDAATVAGLVPSLPAVGQPIRLEAGRYLVTLTAESDVDFGAGVEFMQPSGISAEEFVAFLAGPPDMTAADLAADAAKLAHLHGRGRRIVGERSC